MISSNVIANILGVLSLISISTIILPTLKGLIGQNKYQILLNSKIAYLGVLITLCLGLMHGLIATQSITIDYYNLNSYWIYIAGLFIFNLVIFILFNFQELKSNGQKLRYINYALLLLLVCHVGQKILP